MMKRTSFLVLDLGGLEDLHRSFQLKFHQYWWLGIDLDYYDTEWFALETN